MFWDGHLAAPEGTEGPRATEGPIATQWGVVGWPSAYSACSRVAAGMIASGSADMHRCACSDLHFRSQGGDPFSRHEA